MKTPPVIEEVVYLEGLVDIEVASAKVEVKYSSPIEPLAL